jgi:chemotaxis methyl-accepting protein methylase
MNNEILEVIKVMNAIYGVDISVYDKLFLGKAINKRLLKNAIVDIVEYIDYLSQNSLESDKFLNSLNITHSDFFRNTIAFAFLEQWIIPKLIEEKSGGEIRIWSAGCSDGQEPYSIAMLFEKFNTTMSNPVKYRVIATDISKPTLNFARVGVYSKDAVENMKLKYLNEYFSNNGDSYTICPKIQKNVSFSTYDLLDKESNSPQEGIYGDFDMVFCSNLLFYYNPIIQQFILQKVVNALNSKGYLVTGESERGYIEKTTGLYMVSPPASIFQKVTSGGAL